MEKNKGNLGAEELPIEEFENDNQDILEEFRAKFRKEGYKKTEDSNVEKSIDDDILEKSMSRPKKDLSKLIKRKVLVIRDGKPYLAYRYVKTGEEDETYKPKFEPKMKTDTKKVIEDLGSSGIGEGDFIEALSASGKKISGEIIALSIPDSRGFILAKIDTEDGVELMSMNGVKSIKKITSPSLKFPEVSDLKFEKSLGGSSDVKLATFDGNSYAVKKARDRDSGEKQLRFEVAADEMYRIVGVDTPMSEYKDGYKISKFITGQEYSVLSSTSQKAFREIAKQGFVMDCLLANWDVVGSSKSNMIFSGGKVYRIDNGSVFDIRARGGEKEYTSTVNEDTSLLRENPDYADIFKGITDDEIRAQLQTVVSKKEALLEACPMPKRKVFAERIETMLEKYGISDSKTETPKADKKVKLRPDMPSMVTQNYFDNGWDELELIGNPGMKEHIKDKILSFEKDKEPRYQEWAAEVGMTVEELKADMQKELETYVSRSKIFKAVHSGVEKSKDVLGALLKGGKFLSQFEIDDSDGSYAPDSRAGTELAYFGFEGDIYKNKEVRPQYGYATPNKNGVHNKQGEIPPPTSVSHYGDVFLELGSDSYKRATITVGDSLSNYNYMTATPFNKPHFTSFERVNDYKSIKNSNKDKGDSAYDDYNYLEVQIHNSLFMNEMKKAHISQKGTSGYGTVPDLSKRMNNIIKASASSGKIIEVELF